MDLVQTLYNMFNVVASFSLTINTYDVIITQPFKYTLVLASFILRHECDDYAILVLKIEVKQQQQQQKQDFITNIEVPMTLIYK